MFVVALPVLKGVGIIRETVNTYCIWEKVVGGLFLFYRRSTSISGCSLVCFGGGRVLLRREVFLLGYAARRNHPLEAFVTEVSMFSIS